MSNLNWYKLDPIDLLLMREAKPFSPGDGSWAKGLFPPLPITVFQAMRSATGWCGDRSSREKRDLEFVGPFFLYDPPDGDRTLWLPTPQDLLNICTFEQDREKKPDDAPEETFTKVAKQWERTARLQPLDRTNKAWQHFGLDEDFFPADELVPMVPPMRLKQTEQREGGDLNSCLRQFSDTQWEGVAGHPLPWMRADALKRYLEGDSIENERPKKPNNPDVPKQKTNTPDEYDIFWPNPWETQVLPHIKVQTGTRQVLEEEGYFTEVAIRMKPYWHLVAGISTELGSKVVRLGGEGHRALCEKLDAPPPQWEALNAFRSPPTSQQAGNQTGQKTAYVLTPGLAELEEDLYGLIPRTWRSHLCSCVGDRALMWGGMSVFRKDAAKPSESPTKRETVAFQPQRAFVPPGTVYRFTDDPLPEAISTNPSAARLLPTGEDNWLKTLKTLNYGLLLWGQ